MKEAIVMNKKEILELKIGDKEDDSYLEILLEYDDRAEFKRLLKKFIDLDFLRLTVRDTFAILGTSYNHSTKDILVLVKKLEGCGFEWKK